MDIGATGGSGQKLNDVEEVSRFNWGLRFWRFGVGRFDELGWHNVVCPKSIKYFDFSIAWKDGGPGIIGTLNRCRFPSQLSRGCPVGTGLFLHKGPRGPTPTECSTTHLAGCGTAV